MLCNMLMETRSDTLLNFDIHVSFDIGSIYQMVRRKTWAQQVLE